MAKLNECLIIWEEDKGSNKWSALSFDAVLTEGHQGENIVTSFPVSKGFNINEHTIRQNAKIRLKAVLSSISNPTYVNQQTFEAAFAHLVIQAGGTGELENADKYGRVDYEVTDVASGSLDKVQRAFIKIKQLVQIGTVVHVLTIRETYTNSVLRSYDVNNDVNNAYALPINLLIEQLIIAIPETDGTQTAATSDTQAEAVLNSFNAAFDLDLTGE